MVTASNVAMPDTRRRVLRSVAVLVLAGRFSMALQGGVPFSTALVGDYPYTVSSIANDSVGNTYLAGNRELGGLANSSDLFVAKLDPAGSLVFTRTFTGDGYGREVSIALDLIGNIFVAGTSNSGNLPVVKALQTQYNSSGSGFVIKLTNDGSAILYATYFGGKLGATSILSVATDLHGNLYLTGITDAADFPHTSGMPFGPTPLGAGISGGFLSCISATGDQILYSGVLTGGPIPVTSGKLDRTTGVGVSVDAAGNAYFTGNIGFSNLPTTPGVLGPAGPTVGYTGYLAKVDSARGTVAYLTYLPSLVNAMTVNPAGEVYFAGIPSGGINAPPMSILAKVNASAGALVWTNNFDGASGIVRALAVAPGGAVWAAGEGDSSAFPNKNGWTTGPQFVAGVDPASGTSIYSARYPFFTAGRSIAVDSTGIVHFAGEAGFVSAFSPVAALPQAIFSFSNALGGNAISRVAPGEVISIYGPGIGPAIPSSAIPVNGYYSTTLSGLQVAINGVNMPLLYVSANQINAVVPMGITSRAGATVHIVNGTTPGPDYPVWIVDSDPEAFPIVFNQDRTVNSADNPALPGSIVTFYGTGWQSKFAPLTDGQVATMAQNVCFGCETSPGGEVLYGGPTPGTVAGVTQFNVRVSTLPSGFLKSVTDYFADISVTASGVTVRQAVWVANQ